MSTSRMGVLERLAAGAITPDEAARLLRTQDGRDAGAQTDPPAPGGETDGASLSGLTVDQVIQFKIHGVHAGYVRSLREAGLSGLMPDQLIAARIHGVSAEYTRALQAAGIARVPVDDLIAMRIHGVEPAFVRHFIGAAQDLGYGPVNPRQLVAARIHEVSSEQLAPLTTEIAQLGLPRPTLDQLIEFRALRIDKSFVDEMRNLGFENLTVGKVIKLKRAGMDADLMELIDSILKR